MTADVGDVDDDSAGIAASRPSRERLVSDMQSKDSTPPSAPLLGQHGAHRQTLLARLLPLGSLLLGIASALWMSRSPERAPLIIGAAVLGWFAITVAVVVVRRFSAVASSRRSKAVRWVALAVSQTIVMQALVFPIPFFARALWPLSPQYLPFGVAYVVALAVGWWDPWYEKLARRPGALVALQAFAAFVGCLTVLPIVGLSNEATFTAAGIVVGIAAPLGLWLTGGRGRWVLGAVAAALLVLLVVAGAPLVPPVPLSQHSAALCTGIVDREPQGAATVFESPSQLFCHTAISAPLGLKDKLVHVWLKDGTPLQTVPLEVAGAQRAHGFRTWSRLAHPTPGRMTCRTETALGQVVGVVSAVVR